MNAVSSNGDQSSETQRFTTEVSRLSGKVDWWNTAIIVMMVFAAVAATGLVVTQYIAFRRAGQLSDAQNLLASAKEKQSAASIATLNAAAQQAHETAEKEMLARVKIEASVAWRHLTDRQKIDIAKRLRGHPPEAISVWFFAGDAEGQTFASDIAEMLREGGMYVYPPRPLAPPGAQTANITDPIKPYETGVQVASTNEPSSRSLAGAIARELKDVGFDAKIVESDAPDAMAKSIGLPNIVVGVVGRPNGPQGKYKLQAEKEAIDKNKASAKQPSDKSVTR